MNYIPNKNQKKAFTLIEVMIALSVFIVSVLAVTTLSIQSIRTNQRNIDNLQAVFYAQQGIEAVRAIRDSNALQNQYWLGKGDLWGENLSNMEDGGSYFSIVASSKIDDQSGPWILKKINIDNYNETIEETNFIRYIFVKPVEYSKDDSKYVSKIYVESIVKWNNYDRDKEVKLFTELTDWR